MYEDIVYIYFLYACMYDYTYIYLWINTAYLYYNYLELVHTDTNESYLFHDDDITEVVGFILHNVKL